MRKPVDIIKADIQLNAVYYLELMKLYLEKLNENNNEYDERRYDANGASTFIGMNLTLDATVFVYEAIKFLKIYDNQMYKNCITNGISADMLKDIKKIRDNMHLFNKYGSYMKKANSIIESQLDKFDMLEQDFLSPLRTDICDIIYEDGVSEYFMGTNYFYFHAVYEADGVRWEGEQIKNYSATISSIVNRLMTYSKNRISVAPLAEQNLELNIFFRDVKSSQRLKRNGLSQSTNFRLLLSLTQAGWAYVFLFKTLDIDMQDKKSLWFFTKYLAIKYDEIIDSLDNLLKYSKDKDHLKLIFDNYSLNLETLSCRKIASSLRNTLHYNIRDVRKNQNLYNSFLLNNGITQDEFAKIFMNMKSELQSVFEILQSFFEEVS